MCSFVLIVSQAELTDAYAKAKAEFKDDPQGLETWLDELRAVAQSSKVDKDIKLTSGAKVAKFMARQKKNLKGQMSHMSKFDIHTVVFMLCGRPDAHAAHAQNAIVCSSSEIEQLIETGIDLKRSLNDLFVKVLHQRLDASGLSKWHADREKKEQRNELRTRDSAYSAASKYLRDLFCSGGHTWFPAFVPWVRFLALLRQHRVRIVGWPLEDECPASNPSRSNKSWDAREWRHLITEFQKGNDCQIKVEKWSMEVFDEDEPIVIDRNSNVVYRVKDAGHDIGSEADGARSSSKQSSTSRRQHRSQKPLESPAPAAESKHTRTKSRPVLSTPYIANSDSGDQQSPAPKAHISMSPTSQSGKQIQDANTRTSVNLNAPSTSALQSLDGANTAVGTSLGLGTTIPITDVATSSFGNMIPGPMNPTSALTPSLSDPFNAAGFDIGSIPSVQLDEWSTLFNEYMKNSTG